MMAFMAYELAINPDIQKKLRDEVEKTDQECDGKLTYESLMRMKYMDMVVSGNHIWYNCVEYTKISSKPIF